MEAASVIAWKPLGELLVDRGLLDDVELEAALAQQVESGGLLGSILVERGAVRGAVVTAILSEQAGIPWKPLGRMLVERGLLTADELDRALSHQMETGERLGDILVERRVVAGAVLTAILSEQAGVELEIEPGFGSGLFAKLATRSPDDRAPSARQLRTEEPELPGSEPPAVRPDDPAFELIRLRSELELAEARIAELEQELAARPAGRARKRSAAG